MEFYEQIVAFAKLFGKGIKVNVKTEKEIISKLKTLKSKDSVFLKTIIRTNHRKLLAKFQGFCLYLFFVFYYARA